MKLFGYDSFSTFDFLTESENGKKVLYIEGVFAQAEKENRNGRIYPKEVLHKAIADYGQDYVANGRAFGELNHPDSAFVNPDRTCILIKNLQWQGNDVIGKARVLETTCGLTVKAMIEGGGVIGVSTRGAGNIEDTKNGIDYVADDYQIFAIDVVTNPSGINCWVKGVNEAVEMWVEDGILKESVKPYAGKVLSAIKKQDFEAIKKEFSAFLNEVQKNI